MGNEIAKASVAQQLQMLKETTRMTGGLHEAQCLQLKMWPLVVFEAQTSSFTWDPDTKIVLFDVSLMKSNKKPAIKAMTQRVEALNSWVQQLLGDEWIAKVKIDGKVTFTGKRKIHGAKPSP